ncbi:MAG TPA: histone deacetylase family protein [Alphaproteobacteria bacterium]|nr:histone deacetylase family protein [Alphaproteobacteria bacterium]
MSTILFTHAACLDHDPGAYHPESPARLKAVLEGLSESEFRDIERITAPRAEDRHLTLCHPVQYVEGVMGTIPPAGRHALDGDTVVCPGSGEAALRAAGAVVAAVDAVVGGKAKNAFCAVRPPGHHAEAGQAMGFCMFNNVAIGALHARANHGLERVAVIDFDVHHGNGTQHMFERDPNLFYASTHQWPLYPGTGAAEERGCGNIVNVPLRPYSGGDAFRSGFERHILPALDRFKPDLVMISAGFDAHADDPLASLQLHEDDYEWVTAALLEVAETHAKGRLVSTLEGGYDLRALAASAAAHVRALKAA